MTERWQASWREHPGGHPSIKSEEDIPPLVERLFTVRKVTWGLVLEWRPGRAWESPEGTDVRSYLVRARDGIAGGLAVPPTLRQHAQDALESIALAIHEGDAAYDGDYWGRFE